MKIHGYHECQHCLCTDNFTKNVQYIAVLCFSVGIYTFKLLCTEKLTVYIAIFSVKI